MSNLLFVTGTDTGVGKTVTSRVLITGLRQRGISVGVVKPVETGCIVDPNGNLIPADGQKLWHAAGCEQSIEDVVPYKFVTPVAPQVAAMREDRAIDYKALRSHIEAVTAEFSVVIVEGAGGLLVPLDETRTFADLAKDLSMSVVVVVGSRLGCINHAALTFEVLRRRNIETLGYVINELNQGEDESLSSNRLSVSRAASAYEIKELAKLSFVEELDEPAVLAEVAGLPEVSLLIESVIKEFGLE